MQKAARNAAIIEDVKKLKVEIRQEKTCYLIEIAGYFVWLRGLATTDVERGFSKLGHDELVWSVYWVLWCLVWQWKVGVSISKNPNVIAG